MNKTQLVARLNSLGIPDAQDAVEGVLMLLAKALANGERVTIREFGKFEPRKRRAVIRKNPMTGAEIPVPEQISVGFVPAPALKKRING